MDAAHGRVQLSTVTTQRSLVDVPYHVACLQEAVHALGEKQSGLSTVLANAGVKEQHDIAGLKQAMQVIQKRRSLRGASVLATLLFISSPLWRACVHQMSFSGTESRV